ERLAAVEAHREAEIEIERHGHAERDAGVVEMEAAGVLDDPRSHHAVVVERAERSDVEHGRAVRAHDLAARDVEIEAAHPRPVLAIARADVDAHEVAVAGHDDRHRGVARHEGILPARLEDPAALHPRHGRGSRSYSARTIVYGRCFVSRKIFDM